MALCDSAISDLVHTRSKWASLPIMRGMKFGYARVSTNDQNADLSLKPGHSGGKGS